MPDEGANTWVQQRRRRTVGDPLGQKIHDILWRPVRAGDSRAAAARIRDLEALFAGLTPEQAKATRARLQEGDLAADFRFRLATETRKRLISDLHIVETVGHAMALARGVSSRGTSTRGTATRPVGPRAKAPSAPPSAGGGIDAEAGKRLVGAAIGRTFQIVQKRVYSRNVGGLHVIVQVNGSVTFTAMSIDDATINAYVGLSAHGTSFDLDIADALFGADASISSSSGGEFSVGIGRGGVSLELSPSLTSPVSVEFPSVELAGVALEKAVPRLGIKGRADLNLALIIDVIPDYRKLLQTVRAGGPAAKRALQRGAKSLARTAVKIRGRAGRILAVGKRAIDRIVMRQLNKFAKKVVIQWVKDLSKLGSKATMTRAAGKVALKSVGRVLGAIGLFFESKSAFEKGVNVGIERAIERRQKHLRHHFGLGFAYVVVFMSDPTWRTSLRNYSDNTMPVEGFGAPFPASVRRWLVPRGEDKALTEWLEGPGQQEGKHRLRLLEVDWVEKIEGAIRGVVHAEIRWGSRDSRTKKILDRAEFEANAAGRAAAFQSIWAFIAALSDEEGRGSWKCNGIREWDSIAELYREVFDGDDLHRYLTIAPLVAYDDVKFPPFAQ